MADHDGASAPISEFQRVHTVLDYYDGPRSGVADFAGQPHFYRALFSEARDDWEADLFELSPLSPEAFALAMEDWAIWKRFETALRSRTVTEPNDPNDWGALPEERERHRQLAALLAEVLVIDSTKRITARAEFRARKSHSPEPLTGVMRPLEVRWTRSVTGEGHT